MGDSFFDCFCVRVDQPPKSSKQIRILRRHPFVCFTICIRLILAASKSLSRRWRFACSAFKQDSTCCQACTTLQTAVFGYRSVADSRSYVNPSAATTGSRRSSHIIEHTKSFFISAMRASSTDSPLMDPHKFLKVSQHQCDQIEMKGPCFLTLSVPFAAPKRA